MYCSRNLQFCVNHCFLLNLPKSKIYDVEFVNRFKEIRLQLENLLEYYQKFNDKSVDAFKTSDVKDFTKNFVIKLSQYLNLSCDIGHELFKSYLLHDGKLDDDDLQSMLSRGHNTISLIQKIKKYYYEERLSLIRIIRYAFIDWKDDFLILSTIVFSASKFNSKKLLFLKLLNSYKLLVDDLNADKANYEYRDDNTEEELMTHLIDEQVELLETMLIATYSMKDCRDYEIMNQVLTVFKTTDLNVQINVLKLYSSRTHFKNVSDRITVMQSLILIELADITNLFVPKDQSKNHFLSDGKILSQLSTIVSKLGNRQSHGVIMLLVSVLHNIFNTANVNHIDNDKMAETAINKLKLFHFINEILSNKPYKISSSEGNYLGLVVHCVLFDLLSLLCYDIHLNSLAPNIRHDLVNVMCTIVGPIISFSDIQPLNNGFMKLLEDLSLSFPSNLGMLDVMGCLMNKSAITNNNNDNNNDNDDDDNININNNDNDINNDNREIIIIIHEFLDNLSWFSDARCVSANIVRVINNNDDINVAKKCVLINDNYQPYYDNNVLIFDKYSEGYFVDDTVVWNINYSAWHVIVAEIQLTSDLFAHYNNNNNSNALLQYNNGPTNITSLSNQIQRLTVIIDFLRIALQNGIQEDCVIGIFKHLWQLVETDSLFVEGCESVVNKLIDLASQILIYSKDLILISRIVSVKNLFPNAQISVERIVTNQSFVDNIWTCESTNTNIILIHSYLKFNVSLIQCEKCLDTDNGIIPSSLIFGSIHFVIRSVLDNLTKRSFNNSSDVTDLASNCLIFLNEILSIKPKSYLVLSEPRKARLELIQQVTHEIIVNSPSVIKIILSMSSIEVNMLLKQNNLSNQMLAIYGTEEKLGQLVWMSLTLIKYIFIGPENNTEEEIVTENGASVLLKILNTNENESFGSTVNSRNRKGTMTYAQQYVLRLLEFLSYPYSIKIARMSLDVLKLIVQNTNISIVACLGEKSSMIGDMLLRFFASTMEDQIVRANLFTFLSECVLRGRHAVLQLINPAKSDVNESENTCYQSCLDIINNFKLDDDLSVKLICSVSKFLSSLWLKECYPSIEFLKKIDIWKSLLGPMKIIINEIKNGIEDVSSIMQYINRTDQMFEFIGNSYGLFGMELYSNSAIIQSHKDDNFIKSLEQVLSIDLFESFLSVFDRQQLDKRLPGLDRYMSMLLPPITWWKTLLITTLSIDTTESGINIQTLPEETHILDKLLDSITNLMNLSIIIESSDLNIILDQLSSCVIEILHKKSKSLSHLDNISIYKKLIQVLTAMLPSDCINFHARHADLLASCVLLQPNLIGNFGLQHEMKSLSHSYLYTLTTISCPGKLESKVLVQAISLSISVDMTSDKCQPHDSSDWVAHLANIGVLNNCFVMLNDCIKNADFSLLTQTLTLLLVRVAHTRLGALRIIQSPLLNTLESHLIINNTDNNSVMLLSQFMQLTVLLLTINGPMAHEFAFRMVLAHWNQLCAIVSDGCTRIGRVVSSAEDYDRITLYLTIGQLLFDVVFNLLTVRGSWSLHWPSSVISQLEKLLHISTNTVTAILTDPQTIFLQHCAYIIHGKIRSTKQISFAAQSPKIRLANNLSLDETEQTSSYWKIELASSRLESVLYQLLHSCLLVYSHSTFKISEISIYEGIDYNEAMLNEDFSECRLDKCDSPLSFGCLFSIINSTHCLLRDDLVPISINKVKISFNSDLMRQIHEIALSIIVSHSVLYLSKYESNNKANRNTFVSNLRTELNCYLNEFAKTRRRNTLSASSPLIHSPRVTSTPYTKKIIGITDGFDLFCMGVDQFKKALDLMLL